MWACVCVCVCVCVRVSFIRSCWHGRMRAQCARTNVSAHVEVLHKSARVVCVLVDGRADPDVAVVAQDEAGAARQVVEVRLAALH